MELNSSNFQEAISSETPVLVKFGTRTGCKYCDTFKPIFEAFSESSDIKCYEYLKDNLQAPNDEIFNKYAIQSFPTTVAFQNGKVINKAVGILDEGKLVQLTKTLQNISDVELEKIRLKANIEISQIDLARFEAVSYLQDVMAECERRVNERITAEKEGMVEQPKPEIIKPVEEFPLPPRTVDEQILKPCEGGCQ